MTVQELINELEYSIKELGFNPNATVLIDVMDNEGLENQKSISQKGHELAINHLTPNKLYNKFKTLI